MLKKIFQAPSGGPFCRKVLKEWVEQNQAKVPPASKLGKAFTYRSSDIEAAAESRAESRAGTSALLYSLIVTAKVNGINP